MWQVNNTKKDYMSNDFKLAEVVLAKPLSNTADVHVAALALPELN